MIRNNIFLRQFLFNTFYSYATILYVANMLQIYVANIIYYPRLTRLYCYHFVEDMILELYDFRIFINLRCIVQV